VRGIPDRLTVRTQPIPESWQTRLTRWVYNWFPAYRRTGARLSYIASDWSEVRIRLPLTWRTRNYVGTMFGGSMYGAVDPVYMMMLIRTLGPGYQVWDKAATIQFLRPGREPLYATFRLAPDEVTALRAEVDRAGRAEREFAVELVSTSGAVHARCQKVLSVRRRGASGQSAEDGAG
jgi:acyl-coenzyme A thioesterase PaaI-like protein